MLPSYYTHGDLTQEIYLPQIHWAVRTWSQRRGTGLTTGVWHAPYLKACHPLRVYLSIALRSPFLPSRTTPHTVLLIGLCSLQDAWSYSRSLICKYCRRSSRYIRSLPLGNLPHVSPSRRVCKYRLCARPQASRKRGGIDRMPFHERVGRQYLVETRDAPITESRGGGPRSRRQQGDDADQRK